MSDAATAPEPAIESAAELLSALAHPLRILIVRELGREPHCVHELVDTVNASQPLVSQHLRILRSARLVVGRRRGREIVYSLADEHVAHIVGDAIHHSEEVQHRTKGARA
jgi:ArsR family transcriptional regulator